MSIVPSALGSLSIGTVLFGQNIALIASDQTHVFSADTLVPLGGVVAVFYGLWNAACKFQKTCDEIKELRRDVNSIIRNCKHCNTTHGGDSGAE